MRVRAAVMHNPSEPLTIESLELAAPHSGEVLVRLAASGVCRTDLSNARSGSHLPRPIVLGHEAAGVVEQVGPEVTRCAPGDHVVLSLTPQCGRCRQCLHGRPHMCEIGVPAKRAAALLDGTTRLSDESGGSVHQLFGLGTFAERVVVPDIAVVPIPSDIDLTLAALLGCGVTTGLGAVFNTAPVAPGDTVVVGGCGGVGMNVVQGAALAGAQHVIGVDLDERKWPIARALGATHLVHPEGLAEALDTLTDGRGADVAFDLVGSGETAGALLEALTPGGTLCLIGAKRGAVLELQIVEQMILKALTVVGCTYGSSLVTRDIPRHAAELAAGRLDLASLVTSRITLDSVNEALDEMDAGVGIRSVILYEEEG
jgi:S-(hydroxymethyl)glutathione dehydrogenase/alcohol dehydrogenase